MRIEFYVWGKPQPGGSKKSHVLRRKGGDLVTRANGSPVVVTRDDNDRVMDWRQAVAHAARQVYDGELLTGPLAITVAFQFARPKGHYGTGKNASVLRGSADEHHTQKPDTTKLLRAVEDALTAVVWRDDSQVVNQVASKQWGDTSGARVVIETI